MLRGLRFGTWQKLGSFLHGGGGLGRVVIVDLQDRAFEALPESMVAEAEG